MKSIKSEKGQSLVEMAISMVILLYLIVGIAEFAMILFQYVQLRDAAQEGALYGSFNPEDSAGIDSRARGASRSPLDLANLPCLGPNTPNSLCSSVDYLDKFGVPGGNLCEGDGVKVTVTYNHKIFMPFVAQMIGRPTILLTATVTDTILSPVCTP